MPSAPRPDFSDSVPTAPESRAATVVAPAYPADSVSPGPAPTTRRAPRLPPGQRRARLRPACSDSLEPASRPPLPVAALLPDNREPLPAAPQSPECSRPFLCCRPVSPTPPPVSLIPSPPPDDPHTPRYRLRARDHCSLLAYPQTTVAVRPWQPSRNRERPKRREHCALRSYPAFARARRGGTAALRRSAARPACRWRDWRSGPHHPVAGARLLSRPPGLFHTAPVAQTLCRDRDKPQSAADSFRSLAEKSGLPCPVLRGHSDSNWRQSTAALTRWSVRATGTLLRSTRWRGWSRRGRSSRWLQRGNRRQNWDQARWHVEKKARLRRRLPRYESSRQGYRLAGLPAKTLWPLGAAHRASA